MGLQPKSISISSHYLLEESRQFQVMGLQPKSTYISSHYLLEDFSKFKVTGLQPRYTSLSSCYLRNPGSLKWWDYSHCLHSFLAVTYLRNPGRQAACDGKMWRSKPSWHQQFHHCTSHWPCTSIPGQMLHHLESALADRQKHMAYIFGKMAEEADKEEGTETKGTTACSWIFTYRQPYSAT